ncbi:TPA: hypothetical protein ACGG8D_003572 [Vibrio cholerae]|uniref:hypothetical protein n=1 Tax=Vibrio cholerae TaxID=666 RepID=UPI00053C8ABD|nr:hypothetical protein [Vibrio cholerae]EGR2498623.1 hypothetical protein [Vibrio cholerae]EGR4126209.1 hypothetical protein [Vibrio cholerae]EGR4144330.1 hypothetical protein [Vibrio cholerae]EKY3318939.1 hypothetical protein [Vibrio cholerae]ELN6894417.1 hypothetical protein [Vibrio cholerae]
MQTRFFADPESILGTLARLFAAKGAAREVAVLTYSSPEVKESYYDNWNGGTTHYTLYLHVPINLYPQLESDLAEIENTILENAGVFLSNFENDKLSTVKIIPAVLEDPQWRDKASAWLSGSKITNQGRVRSDNVAPLTADGLLFRSQPEIHFYRALKSEGVSFSPLPVFIRGGQTYSRIEPDFVIVHHGITMVVEIDGDTVHQETPAEAQARVRTLQHEGVHVERILASECNEPQKAIDAVKRILVAIDKLKASK